MEHTGFACRIDIKGSKKKAPTPISPDHIILMSSAHELLPHTPGCSFCLMTRLQFREQCEPEQRCCHPSFLFLFFPPLHE